MRFGIKICGAIFLLVWLTGCAGNIAQKIFVITTTPAQTSSSVEEIFNRIALSSGYYPTHAKDVGTVYNSHAETGERILILDYKRPDNPSLALYVLRDSIGTLDVIIEDSNLAPLPQVLCKDFLELFQKAQKQIGPDLVTESYDGDSCVDKK